MSQSMKDLKTKELFNQLDRGQLVEELRKEQFKRKTLSFYRYVAIQDPEEFRHSRYLRFKALGVLGRIYVAKEGINAQVSVPIPMRASFQKAIEADFPGIAIKEAVEEAGDSFLKLSFKVREKILADGQIDGSYDVSNVGTHLTAKEWNKAAEEPESILVDVRNYYEHEVGHFRNALKPPVDSFKEELPVIEEMLNGKEDQKILLYCTGGIRCEKTSAWLKSKGFNDVNQLHGGIIDYYRQVEEEGLENKFIGKNFVFDGRLGEKISGEVISNCHQCNEKCDSHTNCAWEGCHILFLQCTTCSEQMKGCCSPECFTAYQLPEKEQQELRKIAPQNPPGFYNKSKQLIDQKVRLR